MNCDLCLVIFHCGFFLAPVAQTYCKLTLLTFIFSSPVCLDSVPFSTLVGGRYITICCKVTELWLCKPPVIPPCCLMLKSLQARACCVFLVRCSISLGVEGPWDRALNLGEVCLGGSLLIAFCLVPKQVRQIPALTCAGACGYRVSFPMETALGHFSLTHSKCPDTPKVPKGKKQANKQNKIAYLLLAFILVG